jgi:hypothetical protein
MQNALVQATTHRSFSIEVVHGVSFQPRLQFLEKDIYGPMLLNGMNEQNEQVNGGLSRKIPSATRGRAFRLWLRGESYRRICAETGMSLGALSAHVNELRRKAPDLDQLRELNVVLRRGGSTVFDAVRGGRLLDRAGRLGVSLDELESYLRLTERISPEKGAEAERFVESALKLMKLEGETGKTHGQITKDFEEKRSEIKRLGEERDGLEEEIRELKEELTKTERGLSSKVQELKSVLETEERLERLGLEKLAHLAKFVEDYEALGFSAQQVQRLAEWRKSLAEMGIDPDKLGQYIKERGSLEKQISRLRREEIARRRKVKQLKGEHLRLWGQTTSLRDKVSKLFDLEFALKEGRLTLPCKICRMQGVSMDLASVENAIVKGSWCSGVCVFCGHWSSYSAWEAAWFVAQLVLPAIRPTRSGAQQRGG